MVTGKMVRERACELAVTNGRTWQNVFVSDFAQARRELTGEPDLAHKTAVLEPVLEKVHHLSERQHRLYAQATLSQSDLEDLAYTNLEWEQCWELWCQDQAVLATIEGGGTPHSQQSMPHAGRGRWVRTRPNASLC